MDTSALVLGLRVVLALAVVLGLLWWLGRRTAGGRRVAATAVRVVGRQSLGRHAGVAVVEVEGRRLLLGVSDQGVSLLTELQTPVTGAEPAERTEIDLAELDLIPSRTDRSETDHNPAARTPAVPTPRNPLEGSILDVTAWRQAVVAVQERTIRR